MTGDARILEDFIDQLPRRRKQAIAVLADFIALPLALLSAIFLRLGEIPPDIGRFWPAFVVSALVCVPVFGTLGLYRHVVRHMGRHAMWTVVKGVTITAVAVAAVAWMVPLKGFPRSVPVIFWFMTLVYVAGSRFAVRAYFQWLQDKLKVRQSVIIYGAGENGVHLAQLLLQQGTYVPVAFVDDDKRLHMRMINGLYVFSPQQMDKLLSDTDARQVFLAINSQAVNERRRIIEFLEPYGLRIRLIPDVADLVSGRQSVVNLRDVEVEDLIGRDQVAPLPHLLRGSVAGKNVLVTGAGGSIGSELCRQILRLGPSRLVLLDQSEYGLYQLKRELDAIAATEGLAPAADPVLGSVANRALMTRVLSKHAIDTLYHAAAYKHVGMVEQNVIEGLKNNTFGTLHSAEAARDTGVSDFILISTDKAVRTTSIMGASKRLAEMTLQAMQDEVEGTRFSIVRFGNVLGSSGSVVPLFLEQIEEGGPVTVTHPEATRYFMTIPEAAQLVLQAASLARGGDVFLLDMGQPLGILDLAMRMIRLKGYTLRDEEHPEGDIAIRITGLQPGENLHEQLLLGKAVAGTEHRKIMRAEVHYLPWPDLKEVLDVLEASCDAYDYEGIRDFLEKLLTGSDLAAQLSELRMPAEIVPIKTVKPKPVERSD
ncbi:MAG: nucleoside-diphosphate sugar epimerase/dehydratase [Pseudomonadales bacterium]